MQNRVGMAALVLSFALVGAACGGGDDDAGTDTSAATSTTTAAETTTTSSEPVSGDSDSSWCRQARAAAAGESDSPLQFDFLSATSGDLETIFKDNRDNYQRIADEAPREIADDVAVFSGLFDTMIQLGDANGWMLQAMASDPAFAATFTDPALETAANNIDRYTTDVCGVDFGIDLGGDVSGPPTTTGAESDADRFLELLFIPRAILTDDQYECIGDEVEAFYPDGLPATFTQQLAEDSQTIVENCGLIPEG